MKLIPHAGTWSQIAWLFYFLTYVILIAASANSIRVFKLSHSREQIKHNIKQIKSRTIKSFLYLGIGLFFAAIYIAIEFGTATVDHKIRNGYFVCFYFN